MTQESDNPANNESVKHYKESSQSDQKPTIDCSDDQAEANILDPEYAHDGKLVYTKGIKPTIGKA